MVDESETLDVAAAEERAEALRAIFGDAVGLAHGKMAGPERDAAMERFQRGTTTILVATTVVEVGVDVPEATIMIVEHAERFGLAQLHQLRGRVGRGASRSSCLLLYKGPLGEAARARLEILRETEDGFRIAEEDLKLRGEGDVLGARQAGAPGFRFARLEIHSGLLARARAEAEAALKRDERLAGREEPRPEAAALPVRARRGRAADRGRLNGARLALPRSNPGERRADVMNVNGVRAPSPTISPHNAATAVRAIAEFSSGWNRSGSGAVFAPRRLR